MSSHLDTTCRHFSGEEQSALLAFTMSSSAYLAYCLIPMPPMTSSSSRLTGCSSRAASRALHVLQPATSQLKRRTPNHALQRTPGSWRSVTGRGSHPTGSVTGWAARHEARHRPRLRLAPACSQPRPRPESPELGVVRRRYALTEKHKTTHQ